MQTGGSYLCIQLVVALCLTSGVQGASRLCAYSKQSVVKIAPLERSDDDGDGITFNGGELVDGNRTERCPPSLKYCFTLWQEDYTNRNLTVILAQGCWETAADMDCREGECISNKRPLKLLNNTKFCCCIGDRCNENVTSRFNSYDDDDDEPTPRFVEHASYDTQTVIIAVVTMCSFAMVIALATCIMYHMCSSSQKPNPDVNYLMEPPPPSSPLFNIDSLKIREAIGRGRYGHVYRGTMYNQSVAVKIFAAQNRSYYLNERYIYCLPYMDHPCLLKLLGAEERTGADDRPEYLLVMSYSPAGCLQEYLTSNTFDWPTFCKMAQSVTQGLAHLHTEVIKDGKIKMCIAHRDLTSRNILMKADGSCMLCDFGFAICISGSKYYVGGEEQVAEATSLTDVGTLRYMAPEVLEGAVNLRDCESSLKQIDVYALGLVIWEIATRCTDFFQGVEVPEYKLPFVAEIGIHPSMEQMQVLVAKHKARPLFPDIWKDTNPALRSLKETIDDCWDQDAEARLTSLCVEERLIELPILWDRHKAGTTIQGISPTVNPTSTQQFATTPATAIQSSTNVWNKSFELPVIKGSSDIATPNNGGQYCNDCSISENTAETSINVSPSELTPNSCASCSSNSGSNTKNLSTNNITVSSLRVTVPLQPYQGKNPIMERNLIIQPVEELAVCGNSLVEMRDTSSNRFAYDGDLLNALQPSDTSESNVLVTNDELSHSVRTCNSIPYVQNAVHVTSMIPKQQNIPGNGHALKSHPLSGKKKRDDKPKFFRGLRNFFKLPKSTQAPDLSPVCVPLIHDKPNALPTVNVPKFQNCSQVSYDTNPKQSLDTEVCINGAEDEFSMTQTIVRPVANKQVYSQTVSCENEEEEEIPIRWNTGAFSGVNCVVQSQTHPFLSSEFPNSVENNAVDNDCVRVVKRPNTLPVAKLSSRRNPDVSLDISLAKEKNSRSTAVIENGDGRYSEEELTGHDKGARSSLYDDRIMSTEMRLQFNKQLLPQTSSSVPHAIDSLCEVESPSFIETCQKQQNGHIGSAACE